MLALNLFPAGVLQLVEVIRNGYYSARRIEFVTGGVFHTLAWLRIIGDVTFIVVGVLPIVWATLRSYVRRAPVGTEQPATDEEVAADRLAPAPASAR